MEALSPIESCARPYQQCLDKSVVQCPKIVGILILAEQTDLT